MLAIRVGSEITWYTVVSMAQDQIWTNRVRPFTGLSEAKLDFLNTGVEVSSF